MNDITDVDMPAAGIRFGVPFDVTIHYGTSGRHNNIAVAPISNVSVTPANIVVDVAQSSKIASLTVTDDNVPSTSRVVILRFTLDGFDHYSGVVGSP